MLSFYQQKIASYFENSIKSDALRHAYILKGPRGVGKKHISRQIELYFSCDNGSGCGSCKGCKTTLAGANFDIIRLSPNEKKRYDIAMIRDLIRKIYEKPINGKYKLVVVEDAHILENVCQNALLKIIEEPPSYAVFLFLCDNVNNILPTIMSRVMNLELLPWTKDELSCVCPLSDQESFLYNYCMGSPGMLMSLLSDEEFKIARSDAIAAFLKAIGSSDPGCYEATETFIANKEHILPCLEALTLLLRDVVFYKNNLKELIVNTDKLNDIMLISQKVTLSQSVLMTRICGEMPSDVKNHENVTMQIQKMFMQLRSLMKN